MKRKLTSILLLICLTSPALATDASPPPMENKDKSYEELNYELISLLFGGVEIGTKYCKAAGEKLPPSIEGWWKALKAYSNGEQARDELFNERVSALNARIDSLLNSPNPTKELHVEAIETQLELLRISIDSFSGSGLYKNDGKNLESGKIGRIPLREKLILEALSASEKNSEENLKNVETYKVKLIENGIESALKVAKEACERKKKVTEKKCETVRSGYGDDISFDEVCTETESEVKDPVAGCDVAQTTLTQLRTGAVQAYGELYLLPRIPSKDLNLKMGKLEDLIESTTKSIPKSNDPNFDWSTSPENGIKEMRLARKNAGTLCPGNTKESFANNIAEAISSTQASGMIHAGIAVAVGMNALDNKAISDSSIKFLVAMGIASEERAKSILYPKPPKEGEVQPTKPLVKSPAEIASDGFIEAWNAVDQIIGQAGNRDQYFKEIGEIAGLLMAMDEEKLAELIDQKNRIQKYLIDLKKGINAPSGSNPNNNIGNGGTTPGTNPPGTTPATSPSPTPDEVVANKPNTNTTTSSETFISPNFLSSLPNLGNALRSNGASGNNIFSRSRSNLGSSTLGNGISYKSGIGLSNNAVSRAQRTMSQASSNNQKASSMLSSLAVGKSKSLAKKSGNFSDSLKNSFKKIKASSDSKQLYQAASTARPFNTSGSKSIIENTNGAIASKSFSGNSSMSDERDAEVLAGNKKRTVTTTTSYSKPTLSKSLSLTTTPEEIKRRESRSEEAIANAKILSESIKAKTYENSNFYEPEEEDTLFDIVTKAYIRNYEKVEEIPEE